MKRLLALLCVLGLGTGLLPGTDLGALTLDEGSTGGDSALLGNADPATAISIRLAVDKPVVSPGDRITLTAETDRDCFLTVLYASHSGKVYLLWPHQAGATSGKVSGKTRIGIPEPDAPFSITVDGTRPQETILAYATSDRGNPLFGSDDFRRGEDGKLYVYSGDAVGMSREFRRRVGRLPERAEWGSASLTFRVASRGEPSDTDGSQAVLVEMRVPASKSSDLVMKSASSFRVKDFQLDPDYTPVPLSAATEREAKSLAAGDEKIVLVRGLVPKNGIEQLRTQPDVVKVWLDTPIQLFAGARGNCPEHFRGAFGGCDCDATKARGALADVVRYLEVDKIWNAGYTGKGVVVGIVDAGIAAKGRRSGFKDEVSGVADGYPEDWGRVVAGKGHGIMCATDVRGMAPDVALYDIRLTRDGKTGDGNLISCAIKGYQWAIQHHKRDGTPHILTNSWGIYKRKWDPDYATNKSHPFIRMIREAVDEGIIVLFSAGNCGQVCPSPKCGSDVGPGLSMWGANGYERVITVGAANMQGQWIGYTSQGPAALYPEKPDVCAISHFKGYTPCDNGTSAACPVAAGVVALLKQVNPALNSEYAKLWLVRTAKDIGPPGWDRHSGWGIIQPHKAFQGMFGAIRDTSRPAGGPTGVPQANPNLVPKEGSE